MISAIEENEEKQGYEVVVDDTLASPSRIICIAVDKSEFSQHGLLMYSYNSFSMGC